MMGCKPVSADLRFMKMHVYDTWYNICKLWSLAVQRCVAKENTQIVVMLHGHREFSAACDILWFYRCMMAPGHYDDLYACS